MKLTDLLKEIQVISPGKSILWGRNGNNHFTGLVKLKGFKTSQEALDEINKILKLDLDGESPYEIRSGIDDIDYPLYVYLSDDGEASFVKDLSSFSENFNTEYDWGVAEWSTKPPL